MSEWQKRQASRPLPRADRSAAHLVNFACRQQEYEFMCALTQSRIRPPVHCLPPLHFPLGANRLQKASERLHYWCFVFFCVENPVVYPPRQSKAKERRAARLRIGHFLGSSRLARHSPSFCWRLINSDAMRRKIPT